MSVYEERVEKQIMDVAREAVKEHEARYHKDPQPERRNAEGHWDGEPCELPVFPLDEGEAQGYRFEYTGEYTDIPWGHNCFYSDGSLIWHGFAGLGKPRWILRAIPKEQEQPWKPQVGDVVVDDRYNFAIVCQVTDKTAQLCDDEGNRRRLNLDVIAPATINATNSHYTLTGKNGERARMYEDGDIMVVYADGDYSPIFPRDKSDLSFYMEALAVLAYFNLTTDSPLIMSDETRRRLYGDEYPAPEGE